jgi:hypothetical protein
MNKKEQKVMTIYRETHPGEFVGERSDTNHYAWSALVIIVSLILWLLVALNNAENQRHALISKQCQDRLFPAELDYGCLESVRSREHWWQHVLYALGHVTG